MFKFSFFPSITSDNTTVTDRPYYLPPEASKITLNVANIPQLTKIKQVDSNPNTIRILDENGKVFVIDKQVGGNDKNTTIHSNCGDYVIKTYDVFDGLKKKVQAISSYTEQVLFIVEDVERGQSLIYGMGTNQYRQLADNSIVEKECGDNRFSFFPIPVFNPTEEFKRPSKVTHIACSFSFSSCVVDNYNIHMTGQNWLQGGNEHNWPELIVKTHAPILTMVAGNFHVCAITEDFMLYTGGSSFNGQCIQENHLIGKVNTAFTSNMAFAGSDNLLLKSVFDFYHLYGGQSDYFPALTQVPIKDIEDRYGLSNSNQSINIRKVENPFPVDILHMELNRDFLTYLLSDNIIVFKGSAYNSTCAINNGYIDLNNEMHGTSLKIKTGPNSIVIYEDRSSASVNRFFKNLVQCSNKASLSDICIKN